MTTLAISPEIIRWAADTLGTSLDGLASALASPKKADLFKEGQLTQTQATKLAAQLRIPFGYLFLQSPPVKQRPVIPDLRQTADPEPLSDNFFEVLQDIEAKIAWYKSRLKEGEASNVSFIGRFNPRKADPSKVAGDIASTIGYHAREREGCSNHNELYSLLAEKLERQRVLVFRSGIVRSSTRRTLPVSEFRGFALSDSLTPAIFINGRDAPSAWIFTLLHEAAHLWLGISGVSDTTASSTLTPRGVEALCNQVAAEFLTPESEFRSIWGGPTHGSIQAAARHFKVSRLVIARRALSFQMIDRSLYQEVWNLSQPVRDEDSSGNPYATIPIRSSKRLTRAVLDSAMSGETMLREAGKLLNVQPGTVLELYNRWNAQ